MSSSPWRQAGCVADALHIARLHPAGPAASDKHSIKHSAQICKATGTDSPLWYSRSTMTYWTRCPDSTSLQMGCSARVSQNSQASRAPFSSGSCVRCSMYWKAKIKCQSVRVQGCQKIFLNIQQLFSNLVILKKQNQYDYFINWIKPTGRKQSYEVTMVCNRWKLKLCMLMPSTIEYGM